MPARDVLTENATAQTDAWEILCLPRTGAPPLRFKGRLNRSVENGNVFAHFWERKKGDVVLAYSEMTSGCIRAHALVLEDAKEIARYLEDLCAYQIAADRGTSSDASIKELLAAIDYRQRFHPLVGDFLDDMEGTFDDE